LLPARADEPGLTGAPATSPAGHGCGPVTRLLPGLIPEPARIADEQKK